MMLSRFCSQVKPSLTSNGGAVFKQQTLRSIRLFQNEGRTKSDSVFGRVKGQRQTLKERLMAPTTGSPFAIGQAAIATGAAVGLGALCFYGAGLSKHEGAIDRSMGWPQYVKDRIQSTYLYFGGGIVFTASTAAAVFRSPTLMRLATKNSMTALFVSIGAMVSSGMLVRSMPYQPGFGAKQIAWMGHAAIVGTVIAPMALLGGPLLLRAALYTAGIISGLSAVAVCAPSEKFLNMGGPLAIGLGVVFAASIGTFLLPPTTAIGATIYSISLYGGLLLFSGLLLYDTQKIVKRAETHPYYGYEPYDPINNSLSIYMDAINIFIRVAMVLAGQNKKR